MLTNQNDKQKQVENVLNQVWALDIEDQFYLISTIVDKISTLCLEALDDKIIELLVDNIPYVEELEVELNLLKCMHNTHNSLKNFEKWVEKVNNLI